METVWVWAALRLSAMAAAQRLYELAGSKLRLHRLVCDECGARAPWASTEVGAFAGAEVDGWHVVRHDRRITCPRCAAQETTAVRRVKGAA